MRKTIAAICAASAILGASAEGYQVNTFSARQEGMGHVGVAMKLGSESQIFNPGALAFSTETLEISAAVSAIKATAEAVVDGQTYSTANKVSTPMNVSAASASTITSMPEQPSTPPMAHQSTGGRHGPARC